MSLVLLWVDAFGKPRVRVLRGSLRIGRSTEAEVQLTDTSVARFHATIDARVSPPVVTAVAPLLLVNGIPIRSQSLHEGDVLRFGNVEVTVSDAAREATDPTVEVVPRPVPKATAPAPRRVEAPAPREGLPLLRVAAVTLAIFGAAWAVHSARSVKWRAPLAPEDAKLAQHRAGGIKSLFKPSEPEPTVPRSAGVGASRPVAPSPSPAAPVPATTAVSAVSENPLNVALRSVVSITGSVAIGDRIGEVIGSGFFVSKTGMIITNAHVMEQRGAYRGRTYDGRWLDLSDRERSRETDLGLFAAMGEGPFPALSFGSAKELNYGDQVWAIGSPLAKELGFSVTRGIVSSPLRLFSGHAYLQHDAAINPGNSGGPLVDMRGRLVGVNTWKMSGNAQGLGFAIPVEVVDDLLKIWKVQR
ncbi:MAG: trypsin-like peptidase domain-containing protein [Acidobacteriota bacterium]|nr:trypsin-like peptidase domain-containing protein [Acidobacteriota bacterium]